MFLCYYKLMFTVVGLGNPGEEYEKTRHNTGFMVVDFLAGKQARWEKSEKAHCLYFWTTINKKKVEFIKPQTFMNKSGLSIAYAQKKYKIKLENIIIIYDDIDLPFGTFKISFNRGSGGHKGLESIVKALKSKEFVRIRVGITPATPGGKLKKSKGEKKVLDFILSDFKKKELETLKKLSKKIDEALIMIMEEGRGKAMSIYN